MSGFRGVPIAAALLGGVLLLTGCTGSSGSDSAAAAATSPSPEASASAEVSADVSAPADASASASASALPSGSAASPSARSTTPKATAATRQAPASVPGCRNLAAGGEAKAAVTRAYQRGFPRLVHIAPASGRFFYGQCGTVRYAAAQFQPTQGATEGELVSLQDEGSAMKYFRASSGGDWSYVATDGFPASEGGCRAISQIPRALATAWRNCRIAR
ncbi:hypothetical protein [Actinacidiphila glaucinigra]|uniref:Uncharacterized protein n=1 Tax=Actinacidiphila glaucinigra TaxID=235986 RepID=A0A239KPU4_9ACTN|nr:hypothetical protein [Actinacidiphila glaucinigra]SNT20386.1 hypothetical protein SAMN05216252_116118 [Actinacidiphila glaucinigra]